MTDPNHIIEARKLADEGYGAGDIFVRLDRVIALETAKQIVVEQWHRRHHAARRAEQ